MPPRPQRVSDISFYRHQPKPEPDNRGFCRPCCGLRSQPSDGEEGTSALASWIYQPVTPDLQFPRRLQGRWEEDDTRYWLIIQLAKALVALSPSLG